MEGSENDIVRLRRLAGNALELHVHYFDQGLVIAPRELPQACLARVGECVHVGKLAPERVASVMSLILEEVSDRGFMVIPDETAHHLVKDQRGRAARSLGIAALAALFVAV